MGKAFSKLKYMDFVEQTCGAQFYSQKRALFASARAILDKQDHMDALLFALFSAQTEAELLDWLAESLSDPPALLIKYLLHGGFCIFDVNDLTVYARQGIDKLEAVATAPVVAAATLEPSRLYQ